MTFELLPTIDLMMDLYEKPRSIERFREYLKTLQGETKGDLAMPIGGFNPMGKEHVLQKLVELKTFNAEQMIRDLLPGLNAGLVTPANTSVFKIALNVSDDLKGGWTNRYTSDYDSKFKMNALVNRKFCTPIFWTGEQYTTELIKERVLQYAYRTLYWLTNPKPKTLKEHIEQERFVAEKTRSKIPMNRTDFNALDTFYKKYQDTESYPVIFNFLYGDEASESLEFPAFGITGEFPGFAYATQLEAS